MFLDPTILRLHAAIIRDCERALRRHVTKAEKEFITSCGGFLALETMQAEVLRLASDPAALAGYLNTRIPPPR